MNIVFFYIIRFVFGFILVSPPLAVFAMIGAEEPEEARFAHRTLDIEQVLTLPTDEIYKMRFQTPPVDEIQNEYLLKICTERNHAIAKLETAERIFSEKMSEQGEITFSKIERPTETCRDIISSAPNQTLIVTKERITEGEKAATKEELYKCKQLAKEALTDILNPSEEHPNIDYTFYFKYFPEAFGLAGLKPYQPFREVSSLTSDEFKELFFYWRQEFEKAKRLSKQYADENEIEVCSFSDRYPTTKYWLQALYYTGIQDLEFPSLINKLLLRLDSLSEDTFIVDRRPWWRDPSWR